MALTALGGMPLITIGNAGSPTNTTNLSGVVNSTLDAANKSVALIGQLYWEDAGSHTVDTTGSSSIQLRVNNATFANAGTTVVVGIGDVDTGNGPAVRAVNVADVITMDVSKSHTGGGGGIAGGWHTSVPTSGTKTIAHGALISVSVQMTARGGVDTIAFSNSSNTGSVTGQRPAVTFFNAATYSTVATVPLCVVVASDGTLGFIYGGTCYTTVGSSAYNNGSTPNERGNVIIPPVPGKAIGIAYSLAFAGATSDVDLVLYSDPLGTPTAQKTVSLDGNAIASGSANLFGVALFSSPYTFTAGQPLAAIYKPTTVNNITASFITLNSSAHMKAFSLGTGAYAVNRSSGAFSVQNSNLERYQIGLLIDSLDNGVGSGGVVGVIGG